MLFIGLSQIGMDFIAIDILLTYIRVINIGIYTRNKVTPFNAADIGSLTAPNSRLGVTYPVVGGLKVEHISSNDVKGFVSLDGSTAFGTAGFLL